MKNLVLTAIAMAGIVIAGAASANDHLFNATNAANASGSNQRGFTNPVTTNPGNSQASPGTVPGQGNPNAGADTGTPAVDSNFLPCQAQDHVPFDPEGGC
jgi:hypothetical protein